MARKTGPSTETTARIGGFSDGLFAIVITLLVLDIRPPEVDADAPEWRLTAALADLWPEAGAYLISFVNIYIMWVIHHELVRIACRTDTRFLYLNGGLLMGVALIPFSTALLSSHVGGPGAQTAAVIYTANLWWTAAFYNLLWRYLAVEPDRVVDTVTARDRRRISRTYAGALLLYTLAVAVAVFAPLAGVAMTLALGLFFAVIDRLSGFASEDVAEEDPPASDSRGGTLLHKKRQAGALSVPEDF